LAHLFRFFDLYATQTDKIGPDQVAGAAPSMVRPMESRPNRRPWLIESIKK